MRIAMAAVALAACSESGSTPGPDAPRACAPLPEETIGNLTHSAFAIPNLEMEPGVARDLDLGTVGLGGFFMPVEACVAWSIAPAGAGATIDAATGEIVVDGSAASNSRFTVTANVEEGRKLITASVFVFRRNEIPWHGTWREEAQLECGTNAELPPEQVINEVFFWADGTLWVTWTPFELYIDYTGTHAFQSGTSGSVAITTTGGNYVPPDVDGTGGFDVDPMGTAMTLREMWLGSPQGSTKPARCGHKLVR